MNFLDPAIELVMTMSDKAFTALPEISLEERRLKRETYRILLGKWKISNSSKAIVMVEAVMNINDPLYYREGIEKVEGVNIPAIKKLVAALKNHHKQYRNLTIVGEIHSHPIGQDELAEKQRSWHPSSGDLEILKENYVHGELSRSEPYLVGISGIYQNTRTGYAFYRLIRESEKYYFQEIEWL
jgi:hypothetical protein